MERMDSQITQAWTRSEADRKAVDRGCWFDLDAANHVVTFFEKFLRHSTGRWSGTPFTLQDWQKQDFLMPLFGWKRSDGTRRFRVAYVEIPKKNGKSTLCSGLSLYLLCADGEPGAQVFNAAADRDQAGIVFREAAKMIRSSPALKNRLNIVDSRKTTYHEASGSFLRALSAEAYTAEGLNISGLIFDELHAQKSRDLWDALRYGGASRKQPLLISITTAGWDRNSICWEQHDYAEKVAAGIIEDDAFFGYVRSADIKDDWTVQATWFKANPSLGVTIDLNEFAEACNEAKQQPTKENSFKRYRLNIWTEQAERWMQMDKWDACAGVVDVASLDGQPCYAALDLSSTTDATALVLYFPEQQSVLPFFWIPEENAHQRERRDRVPYLTWAKQGLIEMTPGNVIDYQFIRRRLNDLKTKYNILDVAFDPWNAQQISNQLAEEDGFSMIQFRQGFLSMNEPTKRLETLVLKRELIHGGNPVLRWMASNAAAETDAAGNVKLSKQRSTEKIDGMIALVMAIGRSMASNFAAASVYESEGIKTL
jgi:phage terminase large subunit-like protein